MLDLMTRHLYYLNCRIVTFWYCESCCMGVLNQCQCVGWSNIVLLISHYCFVYAKTQDASLPFAWLNNEVVCFAEPTSCSKCEARLVMRKKIAQLRGCFSATKTLVLIRNHAEIVVMTSLCKVATTINIEK